MFYQGQEDLTTLLLPPWHGPRGPRGRFHNESLSVSSSLMVSPYCPGKMEQPGVHSPRRGVLVTTAQSHNPHWHHLRPLMKYGFWGQSQIQYIRGSVGDSHEQPGEDRCPGHGGRSNVTAPLHQCRACPSPDSPLQGSRRWVAQPRKQGWSSASQTL